MDLNEPSLLHGISEVESLSSRSIASSVFLSRLPRFVPGGSVEPEEDSQQTVIRELEEESGLIPHAPPVAKALFFDPSQRTGIFLNLLGGCCLHLGLDLTQDHLGVGYLLAYPFSTWDFEFGWMGSEATVFFAPIAGLLSIGFWRWRMRGS